MRRLILIPILLLAAGCGDDPTDSGPAPVEEDTTFTVVGEGLLTNRYTSDLWVRGDIAYTGTWGGRSAVGQTLFGDRLHVWDVSSPDALELIGDVTVDARTVNDVKVSADGSWAVITHEGSDDGLNGITLLDLGNPASPTVITRFTDGLESGVHNVWIDDPYIYVAVDGSGQGLRVVDASNRESPVLVGSFYAGSSFLHDVYVRDGLAFLSHWDAGLVVLDVGNGIMGGSPEHPVEVSRIATSGGQVHNAWYWPDAGYVFVGEEDFNTPGRMHVVDVSDLSSPVEVATFAVPGAPPHNFWLDEEQAILYAAWYGRGLRAIDVSGELVGALHEQGRELGSLEYSGPGPCPGSGATCTWAPQLVDGLVYVSDMNRGLLVLRPELQ